MTTQAYYLPQSLEEAVNLLAEHGPDLLVMAGGTLAMPLINEGVSMPARVMGLRQAGLNTIDAANGSLRIGATATMTQLLQQTAVPILQEAAHQIGGWAIRNMGTVGGNLFAPPPSGDVAVALLALDARLRIVGPNGERALALEDFCTGFMTTALEPGELVAEIEVPRPAGQTVYLKHARKKGNTPAIVTLAAHIQVADGTVAGARLALNAVGPHPIRAHHAEAALVGQPLTEQSIQAAAQAAAAECEPFTDAIASEWYRRKMTQVIVRRALAQLAGLEA